MYVINTIEGSFAVKSTLLGLLVVAAAVWAQDSSAASNLSISLSHEASMDAFHTALRLPPDKAGSALKGVAETADEEVATMAATALIRLRSPDAESVATRLIRNMSNTKLADAQMRMLLGGSTLTRYAHLRASLARAVLARIVSEEPQAAGRNDEEAVSGATGFAARLLAGNPDMAGRELVRKAARSHPNDAGVWLALAKLGMTDLGLISRSRAQYCETHMSQRLPDKQWQRPWRRQTPMLEPLYATE